MEEHLAILLARAAAAGDRVLEDEEVYVWWGKIRSSNRQQPLANHGDIQRLASDLDLEKRDSFDLYLTDYRSLYVAEVDEIIEGDLPDGGRAHAPAYYFGEPVLHCDFWFCIRDIRRLVVDDMPAVIAELKRLRNVRYHDRPVSLFGGMVDLPLVVTRPDGRAMFDHRERDFATTAVCGRSSTPSRRRARQRWSASCATTSSATPCGTRSTSRRVACWRAPRSCSASGATIRRSTSLRC